MELKIFQKRSEEIFQLFSRKRNVKITPEDIFVHLTEEIGEIARELVNQKIGRCKTSKEKIAEEIADAMIFLSALANYFEIDLEKAIEKDFEKIERKVKR